MTADSMLVHRAAQLLDQRIGLKPDVSFRPRLARALREVADTRNIDCGDLVEVLATETSLLDDLLDRVTVQETAFFRHPEQFETLGQSLLPTLQAPIRAWSAACSNGQEAFSLAMLMSDAGRPGSVLASDVSPAALRRTVDGRYHEREMLGVSAERRRRYFLATGDRWQARKNLREMVTVQRHNLLDPPPPQVGACQVVLCRNVLIYFSQPHAQLFLERLADVMDPAAYLFVGAAETLWQMTDRFEPVQIGESYFYRPFIRGSARRATASRRKPPAKAATQPRAATPWPWPATVQAATPETPRARFRPIPAGAPRAADGATPPVDEAGQEQAQLGRQLLGSGSVQQAIVAFRQWAYLSPDDPAAHFQLGSALDAAGSRSSALRAYRAALAALDRCDPDRLVDVLHGYDRSALRRFLADRCLVTSQREAPNVSS